MPPSAGEFVLSSTEPRMTEVSLSARTAAMSAGLTLLSELSIAGPALDRWGLETALGSLAHHLGAEALAMFGAGDTADTRLLGWQAASAAPITQATDLVIALRAGPAQGTLAYRLAPGGAVDPGVVAVLRPALDGLFAHACRLMLQAAGQVAPLPDLLLRVLDTVDVGITIFDPEGRLLGWNDRYAELFPEMRPVLVLGTPMSTLVTHATEAGIAIESVGDPETWVAEQLRLWSGPSGTWERHLKDGRHLRISRQRTATGELIGIFTDISGLRATEGQLNNLIESAQLCTWEWNAVTDVLTVNDRWAGILGYELDQLGPVNYDFWRSRVHPEDVPIVEGKVVGHRVFGGPAAEVEYRLRHRDGHWIWVLDRSQVVVRLADGEIGTVAGVLFVIDDRKIKEDALVLANSQLQQALKDHQLAEQRFYDISRVSHDWFWEQDDQLRFTYRSHGQWFEALGLPEGNLLGKTRSDWLLENPIAAASADWSALLQAQAERRPFGGFTFKSQAAGGTGFRWYRISGTPTYDLDGNFTGYRGVGTDITELYDEKARAEEASLSKSAFLADMSHEIRTPLNGVMGMAELLERTLETDDQKRMVGVMRRSCDSLLTILNGILDMSKIEAGKLELEEVAFDPIAVARRVREVHEPLANEKGVDFDLLIGSGVAGLRKGDPLRVQQILHNLISNALKFTDSGEVMVRLGGRPGRPLTLEVRDTGIGMSPEQLDRLFANYSQAETSTARRFGGTGLGLSITRKLVDMMGGEITVTSERGEGTVIRLTLPLSEAEATGAPLEILPSLQSASLAGLKLLVADDNATNCMVMRLMLEGAGGEVTTANDGQQAVNLWQPGAFDAVLLDIAMPVMDGMCALAAIRSREEAAGLDPRPIIAVTANAMPHQVAEYIVAGFDTCVSKPVDSVTLTNAIIRLVACNR